MVNTCSFLMVCFYFIFCSCCGGWVDSTPVLRISASELLSDCQKALCCNCFSKLVSCWNENSGPRSFLLSACACSSLKGLAGLLPSQSFTSKLLISPLSCISLSLWTSSLSTSIYGKLPRACISETMLVLMFSFSYTGVLIPEWSISCAIV